MTRILLKKYFGTKGARSAALNAVSSVTTVLGALAVALVIGAFLSGCATPQSKALRYVQVGMAKGEVLDLVGDPARTGRAHGQDRWAYVDHEGNSADATTYVFFADGRVTYVGPAEEPANIRSTPAVTDGATPAPANFRPVDE